MAKSLISSAGELEQTVRLKDDKEKKIEELDQEWFQANMDINHLKTETEKTEMEKNRLKSEFLKKSPDTN